MATIPENPGKGQRRERDAGSRRQPAAVPAGPPLSISELQMQRLGLLHALGDSLEEAQSMLGTTPEDLGRHTVRQQELCRQLRLGAAGLARSGSQINAGLARDLQLAARRVKDLNRLYEALLRRRRRTVDIFCRVLASSGTTYPAPRTPPA